MKSTTSADESGLTDDLALLKALPGLPRGEQPAAIERLLRNPSPDIRGPALRIGSAVLPPDRLVAYLREEADDVLRNAGLEMLKLQGAKALALAVSLLEDRDPDVVLQAVVLLDHIRDPRALEPLRSVLKHSNNANLSQSVILAIGHVGHAAAALDLIPFLTGDPWLQVAAVEALGSLRARDAVGPLAALLTDPMLEGFVAQSLVWIGGPEAFAHLSAHWLEGGAQDAARLELLAHVLEGLTVAAPQVSGLRPALDRYLGGDSEKHRTVAARCLLRLGPGEEDEAALQALAGSDLDKDVLPGCLEGRKDLLGTLLGAQGALRTWGFLLAARYPGDVPLHAFADSLLHQVGHEHLHPVAEALSRIDGPELGDALLTFYDRMPTDAYPGWGPILRRHGEALRGALERRQEVSADADRVLDAVLERSPAAAARKIAALPPEQRVQALALVSDWDAALRRLPWVEWIEEDLERYTPIAAQVADRADLHTLLPKIRPLLRTEPSPDLIRLVANLRDKESTPILVALLGDRQETLYPFVIDALGAIGGEEGRRALHSVVRSHDPRSERLAFMALARCYTDEDIPLFRESVAHTDWNVRLACAEVLGRTGRAEDNAALLQLFADPVPVVSRRAGAVLDG